VTMPPTEGLDEYSDFTPDRPNPAVNNYPGALRFAGSDPAARTAAAWFPAGIRDGTAARAGLFAEFEDVIRSAFGRSFSKVTVVGSSGHFAASSGSTCSTPEIRASRRHSNWTRTAGVSAAAADRSLVRQQHRRPLLAAERRGAGAGRISTGRSRCSGRCRPTWWLEAAYNATTGSHLQTTLVNLNQVPTATFNRLVNQFGAQQAVNILNAAAGSASRPRPESDCRIRIH